MTANDKNAKKVKHASQPTRSENYPEWYQQVIKAADLASIRLYVGVW